MSYKVVNTFYDPDRDFGEEYLEALDVNLVNGQWSEEDELIENAADADGIICVAPAQPWTRRVITSLSRCRILASLAIGYDRLDVEAATECGIVVTNIPDYCVDEVSNQAIAFLMALNRRLIPLDRAVRENKEIRFTPSNRQELADYAYPVHRLQDQTLGIIGFGKIGTSVGLKAGGLGMRVIAYDPYVFGAVMKSHGAEPVDFDTLLRESDVISVNAYLNDETRDMLGLEEFKKMKHSCYLINTARGEIVNHPALIRALNEGLIAGAGLDVTAVEPIPEDDPILKIPNVILTGHNAWYSITADSNAEYWHKAALQVVAALKGEWPLYAVNPEMKKEWLRKWGEVY
ncbi:MAG: C-terminal binding protein [Deltaproteobacteria bacterium]|nr:C-terminal binding protein [Deltaproteobacteria bacterium]